MTLSRPPRSTGWSTMRTLSRWTVIPTGPAYTAPGHRPQRTPAARRTTNQNRRGQFSVRWFLVAVATPLILEVVLTTTRRMKKGPGRRPQSAKRDRFMELRARGWSVAAAGREVGVSRTTGANWSRGHKVYRRGAVVGFVEALDRLAVRQISGLTCPWTNGS